MPPPPGKIVLTSQELLLEKSVFTFPLPALDLVLKGFNAPITLHQKKSFSSVQNASCALKWSEEWNERGEKPQPSPHPMPIESVSHSGWPWLWYFCKTSKDSLNQLCSKPPPPWGWPPTFSLQDATCAERDLRLLPGEQFTGHLLPFGYDKPTHIFWLMQDVFTNFTVKVVTGEDVNSQWQACPSAVGGALCSQQRASDA